VENKSNHVAEALATIVPKASQLLVKMEARVLLKKRETRFDDRSSASVGTAQMRATPRASGRPIVPFIIPSASKSRGTAIAFDPHGQFRFERNI
jgi:hypothetical protein